MRIAFAIICSVLFLGLATYRVVLDVQFGIAVTDYLKRAADANTVDLAQENLATALTEIERRGLTTGNTGVLWQSPANDVGYYYRNLSAANAELLSLTPETTPLERSNMLMKLRETITDNGSEGSTEITGPDGLAVHPNNPFWFWSLILGFFGLIGVWIVALREYA